MFDLKAKRQKKLLSLFCLSFSFVIVVSCAAPIITVARIAQAGVTVIELIDNTQRIAEFTSNLVNVSYEELGENIRSKNISTNFVDVTSNMEARYVELSNKHEELDDSIKETNKAANDLFSMLRTRANQSTRPDFKKELLDDISATEKTFAAKIAVAEDVSGKLGESIQEYDNILGFLQVKGGIQTVEEQHIPKLDSVISEYRVLNQEVQIALDEGRQVIKNITETPDTTEIPSPEPTPIPTDTNRTSLQTGQPYLGVQIITLTPEIRQNINNDKNSNFFISVSEGVLITKLEENSPAGKAGIKPGDVVLSINNKSVTSTEEIIAEIRKFQVGAELPLEINRNQKNLQAIVRLGAAPKQQNREDKVSRNTTINNVKQSPEQAIEEYYQLINQRKYPNSWELLTLNFKEKPGSYDSYIEWWQKVEQITISSVKLIEKNNSEAVVNTELKYLMKDGREINDPSEIKLILNSDGQWLINAKKNLEP